MSCQLRLNIGFFCQISILDAHSIKISSKVNSSFIVTQFQDISHITLAILKTTKNNFYIKTESHIFLYLAKNTFLSYFSPQNISQATYNVKVDCDKKQNGCLDHFIYKQNTFLHDVMSQSELITVFYFNGSQFDVKTIFTKCFPLTKPQRQVNYPLDDQTQFDPLNNTHPM